MEAQQFQRQFHVPSTSISVAIVACNELIQRGLDVMLSSLERVHQVFAADGAPGLPLAATSGSADVVLLVHAGFEPAAVESAVLAAHGAASKVLLVVDRHQQLDAVVTIPSDGFILQDQLTSRSLDQALAKMCDGDIPMPTALTKRLLARMTEADARALSPCTSLTARERQVLELLGDGLSNKQIARQLGITIHGVKRLVANLLAKLNCPNRTMAVAVAFRDGFMGDRKTVSGVPGNALPA